jgi:hypothetical protein
MLPASLVAPLQEHLKRVKLLHQQDLAAGYGQVPLSSKYHESGRCPSWFVNNCTELLIHLS